LTCPGISVICRPRQTRPVRAAANLEMNARRQRASHRQEARFRSTPHGQCPDAFGSVACALIQEHSETNPDDPHFSRDRPGKTFGYFMGDHVLLHSMLRLAVRETVPDSARADAILSWCRNHKSVSGLSGLSELSKTKARKKTPKKKLPKDQDTPWNRLRAALDMAMAAENAATSAPLVLAGRLAALLALPEDEARLLMTVVAFNRSPPVASLCRALTSHGMDMALLAAEMAGIDRAEAVGASRIARLGLIELAVNRKGEITVETTEPLDRVLDRAPTDDDQLIECLVGKRAEASLGLEDFVEQAETVALIKRMLAGALKTGATGVNILLYGPPGTGKTELAKAFAKALDAQMIAVGEVDDFGEEPSRWARLTALKLAQRVLAGRGGMLLLFDELEDLIGEVELSSDGGFFSRREGSKVFVNRLFEDNPVPTLWTSNAIENVDPAYLRRMSFVLKMDIPQRSARQRIISGIARDEGMEFSEDAARHFADAAPEAATVARTAIRTARLAGGDVQDAERIMSALVTGIRHGRRAPPASGGFGQLDLGLYQARQSIERLFEKITAPGAPLDFSLLLTGPPGTGKTALAHHLADGLKRPLLIKRASDLLSKWVGGTEKQIADAFAEAADSGSVLLFDEIDSLLFDRGTAGHNWEVSQVNELLTWMDTHPMPFFAATNHAAKLDPAAMRRFVFKIELEALPADKAARAFRGFFDRDAPRRLAEISGLTPGDFAVVARQLRFHQETPSAEAIVDLLAGEVKAKPGTPGKIGFRS